MRELKAFGKFEVPDLYCVCLLKVKGDMDINICTTEIKEAQWINVKDIPTFTFSKIASVFLNRLHERYTEGTHEEFIQDALIGQDFTYVNFK